MARLTKSLLALTFVLCSGIGAAEARDRSISGSVTGPRGNTATMQGTRNCSGTTCSSTQTWTGPGGRTATRNHEVTGVGTGAGTSTTTWTGPGGGTVTREGSRSCSGGTCNFGGTVTGPNGGQRTYSGSVTRNP
jgi:hypothetical protein